MSVLQCVHRLCTAVRACLWWLCETTFSLLAAEMVGTSLPEGTHGWTGKAELYIIGCFLCNTFTLIVVLLQRIKTCETFQSRVEIIEERQFPKEECTPLFSFLHFVNPLALFSFSPPTFVESELLWTNKNDCPLAIRISRVCKTFAVDTSSSFSVPDGGIGRCPAEHPSDCQHLGHRRQWQHAHICQGLLQCWGVHRLAAGGNRSPGNQKGKRSSSSACSLRLSLFIPTDSRVKKDASLPPGNPRWWAGGTI